MNDFDALDLSIYSYDMVVFWKLSEWPDLVTPCVSYIQNSFHVIGK